MSFMALIFFSLFIYDLKKVSIHFLRSFYSLLILIILFCKLRLFPGKSRIDFIGSQEKKPFQIWSGVAGK